MIIKKKEALGVIKKFGLPLKGKKERIAILHSNGQRILSTAVPKGRGDMICTDKFRSQLCLNEDELRGAVQCPFGKPEWFSKLKMLGRITG